MKFVGAHVSIGGGVENAPRNAAAIGATAFALFTKNQRQWRAAPYTAANIDGFMAAMAEGGFTPERVLPHDGYLINLANPDPDARAKALDAFTDELRRCHQLNLAMLNFHPGSSLGRIPRGEGLKLVAEGMNRALAATKAVTAVIEVTAGQGSNLGSSFEELAAMIDLVEDKTRVGVCLDTCHMFAGGYDIRTPAGWTATMSAFGRIVGFKRLRGMHLNDAKTGLNSRVDRHESLGKGQIGLAAFAAIMADPRLDGLPLVLETPDENLWPGEIRKLMALAVNKRG